MSTPETPRHTPGPWKIDGGRCDMYAEISVDGRKHPIAEVAVAVGTPFGPEEKANARLIAAAPDLVAVLDEVLACIELGALTGQSVPHIRTLLLGALKAAGVRP